MSENQMAASPLPALPRKSLVERLRTYGSYQVQRTLSALTENGEIRDYDDEIANRIDDARDLCAAAREAADLIEALTRAGARE
jgi:hypothetical protein